MNTETTIDLSKLDLSERIDIAERKDLTLALVEQFARDPHWLVRSVIFKPQAMAAKLTSQRA